jgi:hypothetical protein
MTASDFRSKPVVPDTVKHGHGVVIETLYRHGVNVSDAADELGVASADLRRLLWARPGLLSRAGRILQKAFVHRSNPLAPSTAYAETGKDDDFQEEKFAALDIPNHCSAL